MWESLVKDYSDIRAFRQSQAQMKTSATDSLTSLTSPPKYQVKDTSVSEELRAFPKSSFLEVRVVSRRRLRVLLQNDTPSVENLLLGVLDDLVEEVTKLTRRP